jgi:hypothetical protein
LRFTNLLVKHILQVIITILTGSVSQENVPHIPHLVRKRPGKMGRS